MTLDIKRILVPVDFSVHTDLSLDYARTMAQRFGASLHLLHVCEVPAMVAGALDTHTLAYTDWSQRLGDEAEQQLVRLQKRLAGIPTSTEVLFGNPARCIVTAATVEHTDLIVMGTHGHGPLMHVLMGNVAERVVRHAPCPVLTVREPRVSEALPQKADVIAVSKLCAVAVTVMALLLPATVFAQTANQAVPGGELFRTYCATCHGTSARGDGPLASSMTRKPADLTEIAKRNGGVFPSEMVFRTIDGKNPVRGHGGPDMPVWGDAFARSRDGGGEERVRAMIKSLVDFLESIQARVAH